MLSSSNRKTVLMICTRFGTTRSSHYLTNELAEALLARGLNVLVAVIQWDATLRRQPEWRRLETGIEVLFLPPRQFTKAGTFIANLVKWLSSSFFAAGEIKKYFATRQVDYLVAFSPLITCGFALRWATRHFRCNSYAYLTDFFPFHQFEAGQIPGGVVFDVGRRIENNLMQRFDVIGCMSPRGAEYIRRHYQLKPDQNVEVMPLWGETKPVESVDRAAVRLRYGLPADRPVAIFGGQIAEGRGIEDILETAKLAAVRRPNLQFLLVGRGRLVPKVWRFIDTGGKNLMHLDTISRDEYLTLVAACDVGIVSTIANTSVPTFPSKTIDYLRAGVPIAASVEAATDYGDFVRENGFGVAVTAGDPDAFLCAITSIIDDTEAMAKMKLAGRKALSEHFDAHRAADRLLRSTTMPHRSSRILR